MQDPTRQSLPFTLRDMLAFEHGLTFSIKISSQSNAVNVLTIRGMTREGLFSFRHTTLGTGAIATDTFRIPDMPILISVVDQAGAMIQGDAFVTLELLANGDRLFQLCSGFVYNQKPLSWPGSSGQDAIPGRGKIREIVSNDPTAGNEMTINVPTGRMWNILAFDITLVTSSTAANRRVMVLFTGNVGVKIFTFSSIDQTATQSIAYSLGQFGAVTDEANGTNILIPLPQNLYLGEGGTIKTETTNIQVGDNFGLGIALVEEFFQPPL